MSRSSISSLIHQFKPFIKYCLVGTLGTAIDLGVFYLLRRAEVSLELAVTAAFFLAVINNFILNKFWTFENRHKNLRKQFIKFLIVSLVGWALSVAFVKFFVEVVGLGQSGINGEVIAKAMTSLVVLTWNFLGNKYWTFKDKVWDSLHSKQFQYQLSVVIPAYNEENRLHTTLDEVALYLKKNFDLAEIIVVDDGSTDKTVAIAQSYLSVFPNLRVLQQSRNQGKGAAVKAGVLEAEGEFILFMDADNSTHIDELDDMLPYLIEDRADLVIGSRYLGDSRIKIRQPWHRIFIGRFGNRLIRLLLVDDIVDTQCGFKVFPNLIAKELFARIKVKRFGFDMEILAIAQKVFEYRIKEMPVDWYDSADTRVRPVKAALKTFLELIWIKVNLMSGRYK